MIIDRHRLLIQRRTLPQVFTYIIFILPFALPFLQGLLHFPSFVKYTVDICWLCVFFTLFLVKKTLLKREIVPLIATMLVFLVLSLFVYIFNFQSPFYYLWGVRNNFRFYVAFIAFVTYFAEEDAQQCIKFLDVLFWINALVAFFQFFILGYKQDYLGGIFGVGRGCNGYLIMFFSIVLTKSILSFFQQTEKSALTFLKCTIAMIIAVLAELKFFFVIFVVIVLIASVITKFSWRKVLIYIFSGFVVVLASTMLVEIFGESRSLKFDNLLNLIFSSNYATSKDLGRFTALPTISKFYLKEPLEKIFGLGLGNCDTSAFSICNTPFYQEHAFLNYTWLSSAFLFLETGYLGLFIFLSFFVVCFLLAYKKKTQKIGNEFFCQMSMIMSVVCVILTFYNSSLRMETGYMAYFILALPFISRSEESFKEA